MAAGLTQPQQRAQDGVDGSAVEAAEFQGPVRDLPEFDQSVLRADLVLTVVEVTLDGGEVQPVHLLCLRRNLNLEKTERGSSNTFGLHFRNCILIVYKACFTPKLVHICKFLTTGKSAKNGQLTTFPLPVLVCPSGFFHVHKLAGRQ